MDGCMTERSDAWYRSILPSIGALTDTSPLGWVYIARFLVGSETESERGVLIDVAAAIAVTRAEALVQGRTLADDDDSLKGSELVEEWVYTPEEASAMSFQQGLGGIQTTEVEDDCGCGGTKT